MIVVGLAMAGIDVSAPPEEGVEIVVQVTQDDGSPAAGETVRVTHRPTTTSPVERAVNITDARGRVRWTPELGGLADLRAGPQEMRVRIASRQVPADALTVTLLLCITFLTLVAIGFRRRARV